MGIKNSILDTISLKVKVLVAQLCLTLCDPMDYSSPGSSVHRISQERILEWVAVFLLQGIFPTQGSNPGLLHCRQILYHLSYREVLLTPRPPGNSLQPRFDWPWTLQICSQFKGYCELLGNAKLISIVSRRIANLGHLYSRPRLTSGVS